MRTVGEVRRVSSPVESEVRDARVKLLFALVVAGVVVAVPVVFTELFVDTPELVAAVGLVYALACTGLWAVTQTTASGFPSGTREEPLNTVFVLLVGEVVLSLQTAIPTYAFVTWGLAAGRVGRRDDAHRPVLLTARCRERPVRDARTAVRTDTARRNRRPRPR